jgi:hypothetical protein
MPQPTPGDVHVDRFLTNLSVAYVGSPEANQYIAGTVFPNVPVANQSNKYRKYPRSAWFRTVAQKRAPSTETPGSGWVYSEDSYFCDVWGVHKDIDDQERANADDPLDLDTDATNFVTNQLLLRRELEWASSYFTTGVWATDLTGVASTTPTAGQFTQLDQAASKPIEAFRNLIIGNQRITGQRFNTLVIGAEAETVLLNHPQVIERIKYTQRGVYELDLLASLIGVERILVANSVVNTTAETAAELDGTNAAADLTTGFQYIFGKHALLCYVNPNPGLRRASAGYTFSWTGLLGAAAYGGRIKRFRMEPVTSDRIEIEGAWDMKVVAPDMGIFIQNIVV